MNYKELVDRIKQVVFDHKMLIDFGYGQISDLKVRSEGEGEADGADYPYLFLNPQPHVRTETQITYNFNMIVMDMAREEEGEEYQNFLAIQSDCMQYIDDVIARLYYHYTDKPEVSFNLSYTPFYERFQDSLAGATANLAITVPTNINDCITPFDDWQLIADFSLPGNGVTGYNEFILGPGVSATEGTYRLELTAPYYLNQQALPADATMSIGYNPIGTQNYTALQTKSIPAFDGATWSQSFNVEVKVPQGQTWNFTSWTGDLNQPEQVNALFGGAGANYKVYRLQ